MHDKRKATKPARGASCTPTVGLPEYCLEVVRESKIPAQSIASQLKVGIQKAADFCKMSPPACVGNLGIPRNKMPQIEKSTVGQLKAAGDDAKAQAVVASGGSKTAKSSPQKQLLRHLASRGIAAKRRKIPVGKLMATQREILAGKAWGMADAHLKGNFPAIDKEILVSADNHILDGHHRWAALLLIDPRREMNVLQIDLPIRQLLKAANAFPGVYLADFAGRPLARQRQKTLKRRTRKPQAADGSAKVLAAVQRIVSGG